MGAWGLVASRLVCSEGCVRVEGRNGNINMNRDVLGRLFKSRLA